MRVNMKHAGGMTGVSMFSEYYFLTPRLGKTLVFRYRAHRLFGSPVRVRQHLFVRNVMSAQMPEAIPK